MIQETAGLLGYEKAVFLDDAGCGAVYPFYGHVPEPDHQLRGQYRIPHRKRVGRVLVSLVRSSPGQDRPGMDP